MAQDEEKWCSICQGPLAVGQERAKGWLGGNNAQPVNDGRCCAICNEKVVLPARMRLIQRSKQ